jgi:hypothetical protein
MKKKLLIENEIEDLTDFQKILLLNKGKLNYEDVEFGSDKVDNYDKHVEVTDRGLIFHVNDLEEFLKFFFPDTYGIEGGDSEWDAMNYDSMYYGNYDFGDHCYDTSSDDWSEGYTIGYFCDTATRKLKSIIEILDPELAKNGFTEKDGKIRIEEGDKISEALNKYFKRIEDEVTDIICPAKHYAVSDAASELMKETFCDGLKQFGIENRSNRLRDCFNTYFIPWSALVQMFVESSEFDGFALDVMFEYIEKNFKSHPPIYYEIEYNVWDEKIFNDKSCEKLNILMDEYLERATEEFSPEYRDAINKLNKLNLFKRKQIPGGKNYYMIVDNVDPDTLKVNYRVGEGSWFNNYKYGKSTVDEVISIATQPGLFNPDEFRISPNQLKR